MGQLSHLNVVLHVEDEMLVSLTTDDALHKAGVVKVLHVATREGALSLLESERIDAAIVDIQLRDGDSHPVLQMLRDKKIPFIIASGATRFAEGSDYQPFRLNKPISDAQLVTALERITSGNVLTVA